MRIIVEQKHIDRAREIKTLPYEYQACESCPIAQAIRDIPGVANTYVIYTYCDITFLDGTKRSYLLPDIARHFISLFDEENKAAQCEFDAILLPK